ncbi:MAG: RyR domain protein [Coriobacteriia bacterium]|nr:RyR domain protein [Coriobacteriia bacterium]MBN2822801.1 RyR domain protein [Coriobacteriia bacterium]
MRFDVGVRESLARAIHEAYLVRFGGEPGSGAVPWGSLAEDLRNAARGQADDLVVKAALVGCSIVPQDRAQVDFSLTDDEIEMLARHEHSRWMSERMSSGWTYGDLRDDQTKRHPDMVEYDALSEEAKDKDRDVIRRMLVILESGGYGLRRQTE